MLPSYTVVGGREYLGSTGLSAVLLNRGRRYARRNLFHELRKAGFDTVVSIEPPPAQYDLEELAARFPFVRFVLLQENLSLGEQINLAVSELDTPLFFVMWNDLKLVTGGGATRMAERLGHTADSGSRNVEKNAPTRLCTVPVIQSQRLEILPTLIAPALQRRKVHTRVLSTSQEGLRTLYPFDGVGIYDRERFIRIGGFDGTLKSRYWQLMDFGFRAHLWGEEISVTQTLKLSYETTPPSEDNSTGADYHRFFLKNIAPVFRKDYAHLPLRRFLGFLFQTGKNLFDACENFSEGRRWVHTNRFRWRCDPRTIVGFWNLDNEDGDPPQERETSA